MGCNIAQFRFNKGNNDNMTISRTHRGNLTPLLTTLSALRKIIATASWLLAILTIPAPGQIPQARIFSVNNTVMLLRGVGGNPSPVILKAGDLLQLGDIIDTGKGTVVIAMNDGSLVTIFPNSRVLLKDFSSAGSWRDLLEVLVGRIRARINHAKRPNPYRVYSPIASIAVRGTDFLVIVESNGETRVFVFEGLVEVSSLINPQQSVLVKPGRNIVVRPDGDISLVNAAPRGELNEIRYSLGLDSAISLHADNYTVFRPTRFTAFTDSHFDSLQNPAYATEFRQSSGRFYLVPSFSPKYESVYHFDTSLQDFQQDNNLPNYTLSPQISYFAPIGERIVVGGGVAVTKTELGGNRTQGLINKSDGSPYSIRHDDTVKFTTVNLTLIAARRFGQLERSSLAIKFDHLDDQSLFLRDTNWSTKNIITLTREERRARRIGLSVGFTQDFGDDRKLGIFYRYGTGSVQDTFSYATFFRSSASEPYSYADNVTPRTGPGSLSEVGVRFRGSLTQRMFYGLEGSLLSARERQVVTSLHEDRRNNRATVGAGIGYALRPRTIFSLDIAFGITREKFQSKNFHFFEGIVESHATDKKSYLGSIHGGLQTDLWRNLFAGASAVLLLNKYSGRFIDSDPRFNYYYDSAGGYSDTDYLANFNAGWRMTPSWVFQYVFFPGYGPNPSTHSFMLRYEFGGKRQSNE
jgi:FecR protein